MKSYFQDVGDFHEKFGLPRFGDRAVPAMLSEDVLTFRTKFMVEELQEFRDAAALNDLAGAADALVDLVYVALGTAHMMRLAFDEHWAEVQRANMTKVRAESKDDPRSKRGHEFDVVKPPDFVPPDHDPIIERTTKQVIHGALGTGPSKDWPLSPSEEVTLKFMLLTMAPHCTLDQFKKMYQEKLNAADSASG